MTKQTLEHLNYLCDTTKSTSDISIPCATLESLLAERQALLAAATPFAALLDSAGLDQVAGGTLIAPTIKVKLVKDAKFAIAIANGKANA